MADKKVIQVIGVYPVVFRNEYAVSGVPGYWYFILNLKGRQLSAYKKDKGDKYAEDQGCALFWSKFKLPVDSEVKQLEDGKIFYHDNRELYLRGMIASESDETEKEMWREAYRKLRMSGQDVTPSATPTLPANESSEVTKTEDIGIDEG